MSTEDNQPTIGDHLRETAHALGEAALNITEQVRNDPVIGQDEVASEAFSALEKITITGATTLEDAADILDLRETELQRSKNRADALLEGIDEKNHQIASIRSENNKSERMLLRLRTH